MVSRLGGWLTGPMEKHVAGGGARRATAALLVVAVVTARPWWLGRALLAVCVRVLCWTKAGARLPGQSLQRKNRRASSVATVPTPP